LNYSQKNIIRDTLISLSKNKNNKTCDQTARNSHCIISLEDLKYFTKAPNFLAYKLELEHDPVAYQCLEEWYETKRKERRLIDISRYCRYIHTFSNITKCEYFL
jgi:hypothetical protein